MTDIVFAPARMADLDAVVDLFVRARRVCLPFLPVLHSRDEDIAFLAQYVPSGQLVLARLDSGLAGFMVQTPGWIEQLYLDPDLRRLGIGKSLVELAKQKSEALELWCFADNLAARAFYAAQGFAEIRGTDGDNEAGLPDILFRWQRQR